jgi:hypothetical protein
MPQVIRRVNPLSVENREKPLKSLEISAKPRIFILP